MNFLKDNLIYLRKMYGKTQDDVAEKFNVTRQTVSKWERGESCPDIDIMIELSQLYNLGMDALIKSDLTTTPTLTIKSSDNKTENGAEIGKSKDEMLENKRLSFANYSLGKQKKQLVLKHHAIINSHYLKEMIGELNDCKIIELYQNRDYAYNHAPYILIHFYTTPAMFNAHLDWSIIKEPCIEIFDRFGVAKRLFKNGDVVIDKSMPRIKYKALRKKFLEEYNNKNQS